MVGPNRGPHPRGWNAVVTVLFHLQHIRNGDGCSSITSGVEMARVIQSPEPERPWNLWTHELQ